MINCECFEVPVYLQSNDSWDIARLEPALHNDMPELWLVLSLAYDMGKH